MKRKGCKIVLPAVLCAALLAGCARGAAAPDPAGADARFPTGRKKPFVFPFCRKNRITKKQPLWQHTKAPRP